jgi:hypothetical protein
MVVMSDAKEAGLRRVLEVGDGLKRAQNVFNDLAGRELAAIIPVGSRQPVMECRGSESVDFTAQTERDLGVEPAVGRPNKPGAGCYSHENTDRSARCRRSAEDGSVGRERGHWDTGSGTGIVASINPSAGAQGPVSGLFAVTAARWRSGVNI